MGAAIGHLRYHPQRPWRRFNELLADVWLRKWMGRRAYEAAWEFQLQGKFGQYYDQVNLAWFWARVAARTTKLAYFDGGFQAFVDALAARAGQQGAQLHPDAAVRSIHPRPAGGYLVQVGDATPQAFDVVLSTTSPGLMQKLAPDLPATYLASSPG